MRIFNNKMSAWMLHCQQTPMIPPTHSSPPPNAAQRGVFSTPPIVYEQQFLSVEQLVTKLSDGSQSHLPFVVPKVMSRCYPPHIGCKVLGIGCYGIVINMIMTCPMSAKMRIKCAVKFIKDVPIVRGFGSAPPAVEIDIHRHVWINSRPLTVPEFLSGPHRVHDWVGVSMERMGPSVDLAFVATKIDSRNCAAIFADMARCLANVHECGVVHGDVKLSNFVLAAAGEQHDGVSRHSAPMPISRAAGVKMAQQKGPISPLSLSSSPTIPQCNEDGYCKEETDEEDDEFEGDDNTDDIATTTYSSCRIIDFGCSVAEGVFPVGDDEPIYLERGDPAYYDIVRKMPGLHAINTRSRRDTFRAAQCIDVWKLANLGSALFCSASGYSIPAELDECVKSVGSRVMTFLHPARKLECAIKEFIAHHRF